MNNKTPIYVVVIIILISSLFLFVFSPSNSKKESELLKLITNFEECKNAGNPILESYPEQCMTPDGRSFVRELTNEEKYLNSLNETNAYIESKNNLIRVTSPQIFETIKSPLKFSGLARGYWFFEASFPVVLVDWDGKIIAESYATAVLDKEDENSTWMTEDFVPFEGTITFSNPSWSESFSKRGALILQKDNPSGLAENDDAIEIPALFE